MSASRHILCMKWGTKYGPEYVNRLYAMVRRHLSGDFHFVCLTDDGTGIRPEVRCLPIPPLDLPPGIPERGWTKLATFAADLHGLKGTALFLDVDVVITGNSSVYRFTLGAHADVLAYFRAHMDEVQANYRNEQAFLSKFLHKQGKLSYWPEGWCPSFKYHGIPAWPPHYWREPFVPEGARIMIFHGECNPPDALAGRRNKRFHFIQPASWVAQHWRE